MPLGVTSLQHLCAYMEGTIPLMRSQKQCNKPETLFKSRQDSRRPIVCHFELAGHKNLLPLHQPRLESLCQSLTQLRLGVILGRRIEMPVPNLSTQYAKQWHMDRLELKQNSCYPLPTTDVDEQNRAFTCAPHQSSCDKISQRIEAQLELTMIWNT